MSTTTDTPRIPASAGSMAAKLAASSTPDMVDVVDCAMAGLAKAASVFAVIGELDLGLGGKHSDVLFTLCDLGAAGVKDATTALRALHLRGEAA